MKMKQLFIILGLVISMTLTAQQKLQRTINAATYQAYDSTTFYLGSAKGIKLVQLDYTTLNNTNAEIRVGAVIKEDDGTYRSAGDITWTIDGNSTDSIIMNPTTASKKIRTSAGTRYTTSRSYLWCEDGFPTDIITFTIYWNSVTTGEIKIYY